MIGATIYHFDIYHFAARTPITQCIALYTVGLVVMYIIQAKVADVGFGGFRKNLRTVLPGDIDSRWLDLERPFSDGKV